MIMVAEIEKSEFREDFIVFDRIKCFEEIAKIEFGSFLHSVNLSILCLELKTRLHNDCWFSSLCLFRYCRFIAFLSMKS